MKSPPSNGEREAKRKKRSAEIAKVAREKVERKTKRR
jgi:hypothetical protein